MKIGIVSISGDPNVGKSTLLNNIMGQKLSIVSSKPQTTRGVIRGIYNQTDSQILFVDNPGFLKPRNKLDQFMFRQSKESIRESDIVYLMVEPQIPDDESVKFQLGSVTRETRPIFLIINKIDTIPKDQILSIIEAYSGLYDFAEIFPISALDGDNVSHLLSKTKDLMKEGVPLFSQDIVSDQYEKYFVSELIREKVFNLTHQEIPYSVAIKIEEFKRRADCKLYIRAVLVVERDTHKGMIIGKSGAMIKQIGRLARKDIEEFVDGQCYLELFVKIDKNWKTSDSKLRELGYF